MEKLTETNAIRKHDAGTISSWSYEMEGHAKKCVERFCEFAEKRRNNKTKTRRHAWMTIKLQKKTWDLLENCPEYAHKLF